MVNFPVATDGSDRQVINFRGHEPDVNDLRERIESVIPYFCANPSCIQVYCPLHGKWVSLGWNLLSGRLTMYIYENFSKRLSFPSCGRTTSYKQRLSRRRVRFLRKILLSRN